MTHRIKLSVLESLVPYRKEGYLEDVLKCGRLVDGVVELDDGDFQRIRSDYATGKVGPLQPRPETQTGGSSSSDNFTNTAPPEVKLPPISEMAKSLLASTANWASKGFKFTSQETLEARLSACYACEFWNSKGFRGTGRCMKCGCSTWAKLRLSHEKCPVDKWGSLT